MSPASNSETSEMSFERPFRIRLSSHGEVSRASQLLLRFTAEGWQGGIQHDGSTQPDLPLTDIEPPQKNASVLFAHFAGQRIALSLTENRLPQGGNLGIARSFIVARPVSDDGRIDTTDIWVAEEEDPKGPPETA